MKMSFFLTGLFSFAVISSIGDIKACFAGTLPHEESSELLDHPTLSPQKDVVVLYHFRVGKAIINADQMKQVKVSFAASGNRLRIDQVGGSGVTILDRPAQKVTLVNNDQRSYVQFSPQHGIHNPFMLDISMKYKAGKMTRVAGYPCRQWDIDTGVGAAQACVTEDGVILSETGVDADGVSGMLEALSVSYKDIAANQFEPPADFHKIMPHMVPLNPMQAEHANNMQDTSEPSVANDSPSDGTVQHADQPG